MARLTNIMMSFIILALVATAFTIFIGGVSSNYVVADYNNESIAFLDDFVDESEETSNIINDAEEKMFNIDEEQGVLDRLSSFFRGGYDAAKVLFRSIGGVTRLINSSLSELPFLGGFSGVLITSITTLAIIVLIIGILLHMLIKSDRI